MRQILEIIIVLNVYLAEDRESHYQAFDQDAAVFLCEWVAEVILPTSAFAEPSPKSIGQSLDVVVATDLYALNYRRAGISHS